MKKVVLLAPTPPPYGGIASWTERYLNSDLRDDWSLEIVDESMAKDDTLFSDKKKRGLFSLKKIRRTFRIWKELRKKLLDDDVKIVHSCIPAYFLSMVREYFCLKITKKRKKKFIIHFRCTVPYLVRSRKSMWIFKKICKNSDAIIILNELSNNFLNNLGFINNAY